MAKNFYRGKFKIRVSEVSISFTIVFLFLSYFSSEKKVL